MGVDEHTAELPLESVGSRLRRAREEAGLSRADIARQTRIAERMLAALEEGNYAILPARTYATGFARSYARAVGLDAEAIVYEVRRDLDGATTQADRPPTATFEPGDPARVPSGRVAWIALAAMILILIGLAAWRSSSQPVSGLPSILPADTPPPPPLHATPAPAPAATPTGPVVLTAEAAVWVQVTAGGQDLLKHEMKVGESFTIPADAVDPRLRTARPDALAITIGGQPVPKISDKQTVVANVPVTAAALLARTTPGPTPTPTVALTPASSPAPTARATVSASASSAPAAPSHPRLRPRTRPSASATAAPAAPEATAPAEPSTATQ